MKTIKFFGIGAVIMVVVIVVFYGSNHLVSLDRPVYRDGGGCVHPEAYKHVVGPIWKRRINVHMYECGAPLR